ncbi:glycoside hydrolase family 25 protein [Brumimicrobium mesophilum]|uniref:glycoside hydrolase family 25 protein n=1 Tax=Brumimicrobium mesophilum TaxID=392717 RepID=UPI000D14486A|nr:GH25 family lysozyme [Brumimicrobium mesophilum]
MKRSVIAINFVFLIIFSLILWSSLQFKESSDFNYAIPKNYQGFGIDVSHHQGKINWDTLFSKSLTPAIHFVYAKATEGKNHTDREWDYNRKELIRKNIKHGAYHFFRPNTNPSEQAEHFLKHYKVLETDLAPVLDVEIEGSSDEILFENMLTFLNEIEKKTGKRPIIYTSFHFYRTKFQENFKDHKFWIAAYSEPFLLPKDDRILYWQFTDKGDLPFHRNVKLDLNVSRVSFE